MLLQKRLFFKKASERNKKNHIFLFKKLWLAVIEETDAVVTERFLAICEEDAYG